MGKYLKPNIFALQMLWAWPRDGKHAFFKQILGLILGTVIPCYISIFSTVADMIMQFRCGEPLNITTLAEDLVYLCAMTEMMLTVSLFIYNSKRIVALVDTLETFYGFGPPPTVARGDRNGNMAYFGLETYGMLGLTAYFAAPFMDYKHCQKKKLLTENLSVLDQPCGMVNRSYWGVKFDEWPLYHLILIDQMYSCFLFANYTSSLNMMVCGIIAHLVEHLRHHRDLVVAAIEHSVPEQRKKLLYESVRYHYAILRFHKEFNNCFTYCMLMHMTCTTIVISAIGFEMIAVETFWSSVRFTLYFFGWVGVLAILCYFGQLLLDESTKMPLTIYNSKWIDTDLPLQKDLLLIMIRSGKPLELKALSFGNMSYETFVATMTTAYSYFTLLLNLMD